MKRVSLMLLLALLMLLPCMACAETAQDITKECTINNRTYNQYGPDNWWDEDYTSFYSGSAITIQAPSGQKIGAIVLKWRTINMPGVILKTQKGGSWVEIQREDPCYAAQYIALKEEVQTVRITAQGGAKLEMCEVQVLTPGEPGRDVQVWQDAPEKIDLMLFSTHPDDEVLWFGGLLPYYAGEKDMDVLVVNAVYGWYYRRLELLDALWTCGVDIYPVMLGYPDQMDPVEEIIAEWELKRRDPKNKMVALIRQYEPDVVVLHDVNGEYGHKAHIAFSLLGRQGVERAANAAEHPESAAEWGVWDVPKTYIHLWGEKQMRMDWKQPLAFFGGRTGLEVADEAFFCHVSQTVKQYRVLDGGEYDNALFGLWRTSVGDDVVKNDLFENIPVR